MNIRLVSRRDFYQPFYVIPGRICKHLNYDGRFVIPFVEVIISMPRSTGLDVPSQKSLKLPENIFSKPTMSMKSALPYLVVFQAIDIPVDALAQLLLVL
jgi:hypothetical protein